MAKPPVRALTLGVAAPHPLDLATVGQAAAALGHAADGFAEAGYEVQTRRLSTRPVLADLDGWPAASVIEYAARLQEFLDEVGVAFCSLGPLSPAGAGGAEVMADLIAGHQAINCSVVVATAGSGLDVAAAAAAARTMVRLAAETDEGFGNFNFAALACTGPGAPFFPAAYHAGPANITVALQGASIVAEALGAGAELVEVAARVKEKLTEHARPVVALARRLAAALGTEFGGIDLSPAPNGPDSIAGAMEQAGHGPVGSAGTLSLAGALTEGLKSTGLPTCGYCGLMLPVMEDDVLARRWEEGWLGVDQLLAYSAVCGTGLDTVPLPGDSSAAQMTRLICDMATLAVRLNKPLSARLLPVPGKGAGERTNFSSPYLVNTLIQPWAPGPRPRPPPPRKFGVGQPPCPRAVSTTWLLSGPVPRVRTWPTGPSRVGFRRWSSRSNWSVGNAPTGRACRARLSCGRCMRCSGRSGWAGRARP